LSLLVKIYTVCHLGRNHDNNNRNNGLIIHYPDVGMQSERVLALLRTLIVGFFEAGRNGGDPAIKLVQLHWLVTWQAAMPGDIGRVFDTMA
jgi:hypothetical protein